MKHLPSEILAKVFIYLHQNDKLECLLVCYRWKQIIETSVLYHTLCLACIDDIDELMKKIQINPDIAKRVDQVMINLDDNDVDNVNLSTFLSALQNMRTFICSFGGDVIIEEGTTFAFHNQIEHLSEYSCYSVTFQLLSSTVCPNLITLDINDSTQSVLPHLKNAPNLKSLTIRDTNICFDDLDSIHKSLPGLQSLRFDNLLLEESTYKENIEPATSITVFILDYLKIISLQTRIDLLVYIYRKYPNISEFIYDITSSRLNDDEIDDISKHGWCPLFQNIGPQLKKLYISDGERVKNLFENMDRFSCQIEDLKISYLQYSTFVKIVNSQQLLYIQNLALNDVKFQSFDWLKELRVLKKLKLSYWQYGISLWVPINLNDIIDNSPTTLRSLFFQKISLVIVPKYTGLSDIESLTFRLVNLPEGVDTFISLHFPKLSRLTILRSSLLERKLNLATMNLISFCFTDFSQDCSNNTLLVVSLGNNEKRIYNANNVSYKRMPENAYRVFHRQVYPSYKSWPADKNKVAPFFVLFCNSLKNITFL